MDGKNEALKAAAIESINRALTRLTETKRTIVNGLSGVHIPDEAGDLFMTVQIICSSPAAVVAGATGLTIETLTERIANEAQPHLAGLRAGGRHSVTADIELSVNRLGQDGNAIESDRNGAVLVVSRAVINFDLTKLPSR
jgi:hypothetical protein